MVPLHSSSKKQTTQENSVELTRLLSLCKLGDKNAFNNLYKRTAARLNGIAYRITGNVDSANEVLQEAFIQVWKNKDSYQAHKSEAFTWLTAIVRYRAYDRLRHDKTRHQGDMIEFDENQLSSHYFQLDKSCETEHCQQSINHCLATLEKKQSQTILMAYLYGYNREEISQYFDTPINTIKSWLRRGLGRLKLCLSN